MPLTKATTNVVNLDITRSSTSNGQVWSTMGMTSGKWYAEVTIGDKTEFVPGIANGNMVAANRYLGQDANTWAYYYDGRKVNSGTYTSYGNTYTDGDTIGIAFDADAGALYFYKNGAVQNSGTAAFTGLTSGPYFFACSAESSTTANSWNFGQRAFANTAPSGYKAPCTQNLPPVTIGATSTTQANDYFNAVLYTGNNSTTQNINVGLVPDFVWIKSRTSGTGHHSLIDRVRGDVALNSNQTIAEYGVSAFNMNTDGTIDVPYFATDYSMNTSANNYVAWNWKANGAGSSNTAGTITSTVSANTTSGFSIVTYTGTGANATVGHGLGVAPRMVIVKRRNSTGDWCVWNKNVTDTSGAGAVVFLNDPGGASTQTTNFNSTAPTSTVFTVGTNAAVNASGGTHVAYCFAPVAGYSAFGSYTGNASIIPSTQSWEHSGS